MDVLAPGTGGANGWLCGSAGGMEGCAAARAEWRALGVLGSGVIRPCFRVG